MVADAKTFGKIAAANALSDIYAMGGKPLYALNLVCFPKEADSDLLTAILEGGAEICKEAGAVLAGGHSIYGDDIKYGLAVTGIAEPERIYRNNTPRIGDALILTKPLGVGIITSADRDGAADEADAAQGVASMVKLNKYATSMLHLYNVSACTDVTGFGLIGHLLEMTAGKVSAEIDCENLPYFENVKYYIDEDYITGGGQRNRDFASSRVDVSKIPSWIAELLFDPQTSGGLLVAVSHGEAGGLLRELQAEYKQAAVIGRVTEKGEKEVMFR